MFAVQILTFRIVTSWLDANALSWIVIGEQELLGDTIFQAERTQGHQLDFWQTGRLVLYWLG